MKRSQLMTWVGIYLLLLTLYAVWTFSLTDPNLVLTSWSPYWNFQQWMWNILYPNKQMLTGLFVALITGLFTAYIQIYRGLKSSSLEYQLTKMQSVIWICVFSLPLFFSYNALSHDVFNYMFNAKMIAVYGTSPYTSTALDFPTDLWTRFMHNTHTFAPYGYSWTVFSLLPFWMGFGKFTLIWLLFKILGVIGLILLYFGLQFVAQESMHRKLLTHELALLFLNPLVLVETVSNAHNDIWMIVPALFAVGVSAYKKEGRERVLQLMLVFGLLIFSIYTKFATLVVVPVVMLQLFGGSLTERIIQEASKKVQILKFAAPLAAKFVLSQIHAFAPFVISGLLFLPLLTDRSQQFHPWYLLWPFLWLPLVKFDLWKKLLLLFSFTSLLRYVPWMLIDGFDTQTLFYQKMITWSALIITAFFVLNKPKVKINIIKKIAV